MDSPNLLLIDKKKSLISNSDINIIHFDPTAGSDLELITTIDILCISKDIAEVEPFTFSCYLKSFDTTKQIPIYILGDAVTDFEKLKGESLGVKKICDYDYFQSNMINKVKKLESHFNIEAATQIINGFFSNNLSNPHFIEFVNSYQTRDLLKNYHILKALKSIKQINECIKNIMYEIKLLFNPDVVTIFLHGDSRTEEFTAFFSFFRKDEYDDFFNVSFHHHFEQFKKSTPNRTKKSFFFEKRYIEITDKNALDNFFSENSNKKHQEQTTISSYYHCQLLNGDGTMIGTIHFGSTINNYFTSDELIIYMNDYLFIVGLLINSSLTYKLINKKKKDTRTIFSKFVPEQIIDTMFDDTATTINGEKRKICILFSDIRSFTTITEKNSAENVVKFLNNYFGLMVSCIKEEGGVIDKFIGDAIVAIFVSENPDENITKKALKAAVKMVNKLPFVEIADLYLPDGVVKNGIGLHYGEAIVGNIGSDEKKAYTSIGNVVSIAEELESQTKSFKTNILFSQPFMEKLGDSINTVKVGDIEIDGKKSPVYTV